MKNTTLQMTMLCLSSHSTRPINAAKLFDEVNSFYGDEGRQAGIWVSKASLVWDHPDTLLCARVVNMENLEFVTWSKARKPGPAPRGRRQGSGSAGSAAAAEVASGEGPVGADANDEACAGFSLWFVCADKCANRTLRVFVCLCARACGFVHPCVCVYV